jgi:hypothetical protein
MRVGAVSASGTTLGHPLPLVVFPRRRLRGTIGEGHRSYKGDAFMPEQSWHVNVAFTEDENRTRADATLELASQKFHGFGQAKRSPGDPSVPLIGQDLAAARALSDLSHQLLEAAADRIESVEGHPVKLHD